MAASVSDACEGGPSGGTKAGSWEWMGAEPALVPDATDSLWRVELTRTAADAAAETTHLRTASHWRVRGKSWIHPAENPRSDDGNVAVALPARLMATAVPP